MDNTTIFFILFLAVSLLGGIYAFCTVFGRKPCWSFFGRKPRWSFLKAKQQTDAANDSGESDEHWNRIDKIDMGDYVVEITNCRIRFIIGTTTFFPTFKPSKIRRDYYNDKLIHVVLHIFTSVGHRVELEPLNGACYKEFFDMLATLGNIPIPNNIERIVCAAVWFKTLPNTRYFPSNVPHKGCVLYGTDYNSIYYTVKSLMGNLPNDCKEGFLTSHNRFVRGDEAFFIAKKANQLKPTDRGGRVILKCDDIAY